MSESASKRWCDVQGHRIPAGASYLLLPKKKGERKRKVVCMDCARMLEQLEANKKAGRNE
jgi:hypothetical protein